MFFKKRKDKFEESNDMLRDVLADYGEDGFYGSPEHEYIVKLQRTYYEQMEQIQEAWSVLYNLKAYDTDKADRFEDMCIDNIKNYFAMRSAEEGTPAEDDRDYDVPAYTRLAMLYERRGEYDKAIEVCAESIKDRWVKGEYARLARMIRKSKSEVSDDIMALLDQK